MRGRDYVDVIYNEADRPLTQYPQKLARHLFERYSLRPGDRLLDVGCGRGEFLSGFMACGMAGFGVDRSTAAKRLCPSASLKTADLERDGLPYEESYFDVVYSKSVIEHFYHPERLAQEMMRVLKPGGLAITMCPDWEFNYRTYYEDYTHRSPFMQASLRDIHLIHGFDDVRVGRFRQLPILWGSGKWLLPLAEVTRVLAPDFLKPRSKWVRFAKEIMLIASAVKPHAGASA